MDRYGVEVVTQDKDIMALRNKNNLEKYGAACIFSTQKFKEDKTIPEKIKNTNKKKRGVEFPSQSKEVREKIKTALQKNYGVDSPQKSVEIQLKTQETCLTKYGVTTPLLNPEVQDKIIKTKKKTGSIKTINGKTVKEIAEEHSRSYNDTSAKIKKNPDFDFENCKKHSSDIEMMMADFLNQLGVSFKTQEPLLGGKTKVDFFIPDNNLVIECNGSYWHCIEKKDKDYHFKRREALNSKGYRVLQFNEYDIDDDKSFNKIKSIIKNALKINNVKLYARNCELREISKADYYKFCEENHLMGKGKCSYAYGLFYNDTLIQIAGFVERKSHIEIDRTCSLSGFSIVGGFSKLISTLSNKDLHTFIDLNYGEGKYLENLGFVPQKAYVSFRWVSLNEKKFYGRMSFKGNSGLLKGFHEYFDAGQQKWIKKAKQ